MLTISASNGEAFCDGHTRRGFLRIGALGLGGALLPHLLQAESKNNGKARPHKALKPETGIQPRLFFSTQEKR